MRRSRSLAFPVVSGVSAHSVVGLHRSVHPIIPRFDRVQSENDHEPDQPHEHLGGERLPGSLADVNSRGSHAARRVARKGVSTRLPDRANHAVGLAVAPDAVHKYVP
jgi:hypothetical protein